MDPTTLLVARGLRKRYGATAALDGFDLEAGPGIHGLLGANGAGKKHGRQRVHDPHPARRGRGLGRRARGARRPARRAAVDRARRRRRHAVDEVLGGRQNPRDVRPAVRSRSPRRALPRRRAARAVRPRRGRDQGRRRLLGRDAAAARHRRRPAARPRGAVPRRADHGPRPRARNEVWRAVREVAARGTMVLPTTVPRRGRPARGADLGDGCRTRDRARHAWPSSSARSAETGSSRPPRTPTGWMPLPRRSVTLLGAPRPRADTETGTGDGPGPGRHRPRSPRRCGRSTRAGIPLADLELQRARRSTTPSSPSPPRPRKENA